MVGKNGRKSKKAITLYISIDRGETAPLLKTLSLSVKENDTIINIKTKILQREGFSVEEQILIYDGKELEDGSSLREYNIINETTLQLNRKLSPIEYPKLLPPEEVNKKMLITSLVIIYIYIYI